MGIITKGDIISALKTRLAKELEDLKLEAVDEAVEKYRAKLTEKMANWSVDVSSYYNFAENRGDVVITVKEAP